MVPQRVENLGTRPVSSDSRPPIFDLRSLVHLPVAIGITWLRRCVVLLLLFTSLLGYAQNKQNSTVKPSQPTHQPVVAAKPGATANRIRRITPQIPDANRFDPGKVFLENADKLIANERRSTDYRVLRGNVKFRRGNMTLSCDSSYFYEATSSLDAFGHVVMTQADTMKVYCDRMHYYGDLEVAKLRRNVKVVNPSMTVTTDSLDYDMLNDVARYFGGGTVVDKSGTKVTSSVGKYELDSKKVQFTSNVNLTTPEVKLHTDVLDYDMNTRIASIEDKTEIYIIEDATTIYTTSGNYNLSTGQGNLLKRSTIKSKDGSTVVGDVMYYDRRSDSGQAQGNVVMVDTKNRQTLKGDNATYNRRTGQSNVQGNVVLVDQKNRQTLKGDYLFHNRNTGQSHVQGNVVLVDDKNRQSVRGENLYYNRSTGQSHVQGNVVVVDEKNKQTLTGENAYYNRSTGESHVQGNVVLIDEKNKQRLTSDDVYYNRNNDEGRAEGNVVVVDQKNDQTLYGDVVFYNRRTGHSRAKGNVMITDEKNQQTLQGDEVNYDRDNDVGKAKGNVTLVDKKTERTLQGDAMEYDRKNGIGRARGNVVLTDPKNKVILVGEVGYHNEKTNESYVTEKALAREFSQKDTIYVHADTLRMLTNENKERIILANKYVRFYRKDIQGVCDSAAISERDSILNMYRHAVIWSEGRQISGEEINVHVKDSTVDWATLPQSGLLVEHLGEEYYNQLSGRSMKAFFENQELKHLDVNGDVVALFYPMENDSTYNKLVNANSAYMTIDMLPKQKVDKIKMWPDVSGNVVPLFLAKKSQLRIDKFRWFDSIRPKEPYDVLNVSEEMKQIFGEAVTKRRTMVR